MIGQFTAISDSKLGLEIGESRNQHAQSVHVSLTAVLAGYPLRETHQ